MNSELRTFEKKGHFVSRLFPVQSKTNVFMLIIK